MPIFARPRHRKNSRLYLATAAVTVVTGLVLSTVAITIGADGAAEAAIVQPLTGNHGFTVVTEGDATFNSQSETDGSWAIGGNLTQLGNKYTLLGSFQPTGSLPTVNSAKTRLLVGGSVSLVSGSGQERINVAPADGYTNVSVGSVGTGLDLTADGRIQDPTGAYIKTGNPPAAVTPFAVSPGNYASVFGASTFTNYRSLSTTLSTLDNTGTANPTISTPDANSFGIALTANKINVWNVQPSQLAEMTSSRQVLKFVGALPNGATPLIINLPYTTTSFANPAFSGDTAAIAKYVLWNVPTTASLELTGANLFSGSLLAPWAALTFNKTSPLEGQIAVKTANIVGSAEIHHVAFLPTLDTDPCLANPSWSYTWDNVAGTGTVKAAGGKDGQALCTPLYIRAVSWNYDTPVKDANPSWPQNFSAKNDYTVNKAGTTTFTVPGVSCGQDDVYATFSTNGFNALAIDSVLTGPGAPKEPQFLHSAITNGTGGSTWHTDAPSLCKTTLEIVKTAVATGTVAPAISNLELGDTFDYTIAVRNTGPNHATGVQVTDTIPSELTITGAAIGSGWTCTTAAQKITCDFAGKLLAAASAPIIRVPVQVKATTAATSVLNRAKVCATNVVYCSTSDATITIVRPGINLDKTASVTEIEESGKYNYTLVVTNNGTATAKGVKVTDTLDEVLTVSGSLTIPTGWKCDWGTEAGTEITCAPTSGTMAAGSTVSIVVPVKVASSVKKSTIPNTGEVCATNTAIPCDDGYVQVLVVKPKIDIEKTASVGSTEAGQAFTYTLSVTNPGTGTAKNVVVTDTLPTDLTLNGTPTYPVGWTYSATTETNGRQTVTFTLPAGLANTAPAQVFTIPVLVKSHPVATSLENTAEVCTDNTAPECDTDTVIVPLKSITLLVDSICKKGAPYLHYVVTITNVDLIANPKVTLTWAPPTGPVDTTVLLNSAPTLEGTLLWPGAAVDGSGNATDWPGWTFGGGQWYFDPSAPGANLRTTPLITVSINPTASATVAFPVEQPGCADPTGDITLEKTEDKTAVSLGGTITYGVTVTNIGGQDVDGIVVTDSVPDSLTVTDVTFGAEWSDCDFDTTKAGADVVCELKDPLASAATASFTVTATVADDADDTITNSACAVVTPAAQDTDTTNNCDEVNADVPALTIVKSTDADLVAAGDAFDYTITVNNPGSVPATDVVVTDTLEPQLALTGLPTGAGWSCDTVPSGAALPLTGASFTCSFDTDLAPSDPQVITVPVKVLDSLVVFVETDIPNTAQVCASNVYVTTGDAMNGCPTSTVIVHVSPIDLPPHALPGLEITKTASIKVTRPGGTYSYTLTVHNPEVGSAEHVVVTDKLDPRLKIVGAPSGTGFTCTITNNGTNGFGATFECVLGVDLEDDATKVITVKVIVDSSANPLVDPTIPNTATACADNVIGCLDDSVLVSMTDPELTTLPFTGVEIMGVGAIALGTLGLGFGLMMLSMSRRRRTS